MDFSKGLIKEMLGCYLQTTFKELLPSLLAEVIKSNDLFIGQDFISLDEASKRYGVCRKTLYNYHYKNYITLHSTEGKTFLSIRELEGHIRKNPLPRNGGMKMAA
jgi:ACT domain-containing protein